MSNTAKKRNYILITGSAGFIGYHLASSLIKRNKYVIGIDNLNNYYSVKLKKDRIKDLEKTNKEYFIFHKVDLSNKKGIENLFKKYKIPSPFLWSPFVFNFKSGKKYLSRLML